MKLNVFKTISSSKRNSSIDICRSIAIISVVLFHFNGNLPMGYLGVDLFFVISGFLIGGILTKSYIGKIKINFFKFFLERGFKVWPSYYTFFLVGTIATYTIYPSIAPSEIIPFKDMARYLFFYQNYTGGPFHWSFDHVWSLCIEEHFYILLPLLFIIGQRKNNKFLLFTLIGLLVFSGIGSKIIMLLYSHSKDTYSATNNRVDALAWGVILNFVIVYAGDIIKSIKYSYIILTTGIIFLVSAIYIEIQSTSIFYHKVIFHSFVPFCFALIISSIYYYDFSKLKILRFIAYYSYNWYLWHPIFVKYIIYHLGDTLVAIFTYLSLSFFTAMVFTILIEEKFLSKRKLILNRLFKGNSVNKETIIKI
jgi:peptidoglycan/LPS O-acetylase OafA/YrhL